MAWKTKFDNALYQLLEEQTSRRKIAVLSITEVRTLKRFGDYNGPLPGLQHTPSSRTIPLGRSRSLALATFSAATPKQTPPANRMETNNENRLRRAHSPAPMKCGALAADGAAEHFWL